MTLAGLVFEGLVVLLLAVAAFLCWRVDARLRALKSGQDGVRAAVEALDQASERARASLAALDRAAKLSGKDLQEQVKEARGIADELRLLTSGADRRAASFSDRPRRPARELFPEAGRDSVLGALKDIR